MSIYFFNTKGRKKQEFTPLKDGEVLMYNCGPTVYGPQHIGNLRAAVFTDILRRTLEYNDYEVKQIINITDVGHLTSDADSGEDKMAKGLEREGLPRTLEAMHELGQKYADVYKRDRAILNIKKPEKFPVASEHISENIEFIKTLEKKGVTYTTSDGVYFDTTKDVSYGTKLGQQSELDDAHARLKSTSEKKNPRDFSLWKKNEDIGWDSPWGTGFPGWHIECSAMSRAYLGDTFDIHTGGIEHIPIHHTNEIAQSENATGKEMAHYWLHNNWLMIEGEKISKSLGNTVYLKTIIDRGFHPLALRYLFLTAHYRSEMNFTWDALIAAQTALDRLYATVAEIAETGDINARYREAFLSKINDDLDTPGALTVLWDTLKDSSLDPVDLRATLLDFDRVLGLGLDLPVSRAITENITYLTTSSNESLPDDVVDLVKKRLTARDEKDWEASDTLRDAITDLGYRVRDTKDGTVVTKSHA